MAQVVWTMGWHVRTGSFGKSPRVTMPLGAVMSSEYNESPDEGNPDEQWIDCGVGLRDKVSWLGSGST
ncbi:hypothetical protein L1987_40033 [Smallanthus sonchifolius]|uniref:Uncharacterized protein n=1 Tax=Smallanthus sonchifolius TaxID=185202 RepID=A0ACB9GTL2_9ASTR|nr:hypothetical protein L1987_40033 [Smallanthus sonchifolius]